jgi:hypothetical protein
MTTNSMDDVVVQCPVARRLFSIVSHRLIFKLVL